MRRPGEGGPRRDGSPQHRISGIVRTLVVVLVTCLVVSSMVVAPVSAAAGTGQPAGPGTATAVTTQTDDTGQTVPAVNASGALPRTVTATLVVQTIDANDSDGLAAARRVASARINGTFQYYRDRTRVTSERTFLNHSIASLALARFAGTDDESAALRATRLLADADNRTAALAIDDAQRALDRVSGELNRGETQRTEQAIATAQRAYDRGQSAVDENASPRQRMQARARASHHYATAWRHAQRALRQLDQATTPTITIRNDSRRDPVRNGSTTTRRAIAGTVFDVQPSTLSNLTILVNGTERTTVPVRSGSAPAQNATFGLTSESTQTTVNISARLANVTATVSDSASQPLPELDWDSRENLLPDTGDGDDDSGDEDDDADGRDRPPQRVRYPGQVITAVNRTAGVQTTHEITWDVGTGDGSHEVGNSLNTLAVDYATASEVNLSGIVDTTPRVYLDTDRDAQFDQNATDDVSGVSVREDGTTLVITLGGNYNLAANDTVVARYGPVGNAPRPGTYGALVSINGATPGSADQTEDGVLRQMPAAGELDQPAFGGQSGPGISVFTSRERAGGDGQHAVLWRVGTGDGSHEVGNSLNTVTVEYPTDAGVDLSAIAETGVRVLLDKNDDQQFERNATGDVSGVSLRNAGATLVVTLGGNHNLAANDSVAVVYGPVGQPTTAGSYAVTAHMNGQTPGSADQTHVGTLSLLPNDIESSQPGDGEEESDDDSDDNDENDDDENGDQGASDGNGQQGPPGNGSGNGDGGGPSNGQGPPANGGDGGTDDDSEGPDGGDDRGGGRDDAGGTTTASATVLFDGDGLPDTYEQRVLETDPLDADSDAGVTAADEADDGVIDGREDFDGDNLTTIQERQLDTDPLVADTDDDNLDDRAELVITQTDPLVPDSDDDGTADGQEDPDSDGLTNVEEVQFGSFPRLADSDGDRLPDAAERDNGTEPLDPDTDSDFLQDGDEVRAPFNTDPTDEDTDGDGTLDGNETYTTTAANETLGVSVDLTGEGNVAAETTIDEPDHTRYDTGLGTDAAVSEFVNLESESSFETATITIEYNESAVESAESNLSIYTFNETVGFYERLNSTVDPQANTVTAETPHFSTFVAFDQAVYERALETRDRYIRRVQQILENGGGGGQEFITYDFEDEPADSGVPENFELVAGPGTRAVTTDVVFDGSQSYFASESTGGSALVVRPSNQPYAEPQVANVSVAFRGPGKASLRLLENTSGLVAVNLFRQSGNLVYQPDPDGSIRPVITEASPDEWMEVTVFDIDPATDTFSVQWETADDSGIARDLSMRGTIREGYTRTFLVFDSFSGATRGYFDNLRVPREASGAGQLSTQSSDGGQLTVQSVESSLDVTIEGASTVTAGEEVSLVADVTGGVGSEFAWEFGDGSSSTRPASVVSHTYQTAGSYNLSVTVTGEDGTTATATRTITVEADPSRYTFERESADAGVPEQFQRVNRTDATNATGSAAVTDASSYTGAQSYHGRVTDGVLAIQPSGQSFSEAQTRNVSVALRGPGTPGLALVTDSGAAAVNLSYRDGRLVQTTASGVTEITTADPQSWIHVTVTEIEPASGTFTVRWESASASGVERGLSLGAEAGYTRTVLRVAGGEAYIDDLEIANESQQTGLATAGQYRETEVTATVEAIGGPTVPTASTSTSASTASTQSVSIPPCAQDGPAPASDPDNDGIASIWEQCGIPTIQAGNVTTDPRDDDTDGDRLTDGEEVDTSVLLGTPGSPEDVAATGSALSIPLSDLGEPKTPLGFSLVANPRQTDSDNDGLSDQQETTGWSIDVLDTHSDAVSFQQELTADDGSPSDYVSSPTVTPDPLTSNSDEDYLSDRREYELGTDPESADTDTDGTDDDEEIGRVAKRSRVQ